MNDKLKKIIKHYGVTNQLKYFQSEVYELTEAVLWHEFHPEVYGNIESIAEEIADVSVNIYAFLKAQKTGKEVNLCCAIGDEYIDGKPYNEIVEIARKFINELGGFEKFAEWGLF